MSIKEKLEPLVGRVYELAQPFQGDYATTWTVSATDGHFILKTVRQGHSPETLQREQTVLAALPRAHLLEVPQAVGMFEFNGAVNSLQTCLNGQNLVHALAQADEPSRHDLVRSWGQALREIHGWRPPLTFQESPLESLEMTKQRTKPDEVVEQGPFKGWSAHAILDELERTQHLIQPVMTFTHSDFCVPNALVQGQKVSGIVDWGTGRYSDFRLDLAAASWSLEYNLKSRDYLPSLLGGYEYIGTLEELRWFEGLWVLPV